MDAITKQLLMAANQAPEFTYKEGFTGSYAHNTDITLNLTTPATPFRWLLVAVDNSNSSSSTQRPNTIFINGSSTYLGNASGAYGNGVSSDGNSTAQAYVTHTLCRIPTGTSVTLKVTNTASDSGQYQAAVIYLPTLAVTRIGTAAGDAGSTKNAFSLPVTKGGIVLANFRGSYGTYAAISWTNLTKVPVTTTAVHSLAYAPTPTTGTLSVDLDHSSTDLRVVAYSSYAPA